MKKINFSKYENVLIITNQEEINKAIELFNNLGENGLEKRCLLLVTDKGRVEDNPIALNSIRNADHVIRIADLADLEYEGV